MKNFLKENWFRVCALILTGLIMGGFFYLFSVRPVMIKSSCAVIESGFIPLGQSYRQATDDEYKFCLRRHGL
jgi:hypothetical protein